MKKIELLHFTVAKKITTARHCRAVVIFFVICSNPVQPGLTGFEQLSKFVSSNLFPAKSLEQSRVEQSQFEQFTPTLILSLSLTFCYSGSNSHYHTMWCWSFKIYKYNCFFVQSIRSLSSMEERREKSCLLRHWEFGLFPCEWTSQHDQDNFIEILYQN